jgi:RNA polymerase sigma-70 factor (ECF subfamily)
MTAAMITERVCRQYKDRVVPQSPERRQFVALVESHGAALMAMLRRLCRHEHDAEDAFQEAATRIWKGLAVRRPVNNPRGWMMTIGYRAFVDLRRKANRCEDLPELPDLRLGSPAQHAIANEEAQRVRSALGDLPPQVREIFVLHYTGGLSLQETADAMLLPVGTVKSRLNSALSQLRRSFE